MIWRLQLLLLLLLLACCFLGAFAMLRVVSFGGVRAARALVGSRLVPISRSSMHGNSKSNSYMSGSSFPIVDKADRMEVLKRFGTDMRENDEGVITLRECKLCDKGNRDKADNIWKLGVFPTGNYHCFRCSCSGGWEDLKQKSLNQQLPNQNSQHIFSPNTETPEVNVFAIKGRGPGRDQSPVANKLEAPYVIPSQFMAFRPFYNLFPDEKHSRKDTLDDLVDRKDVKEYLNNVRGLNDEVLKVYGVGYTRQEFLSDNSEWESQVCVTFPWQMPRAALVGMPLNFSKSTDENTTREDVIVRTKYRALATKGLQRITPKGGMWGFFGWHTVATTTPSSGSQRAIILTEGEYDAMAVYQGLAALPDGDPLKCIPSVSLPNGCNSLPQQLIPLLEPFNKIYLWFDNDKSGQDACAKFLPKLGAHRCVVVSPNPNMKNPPKDANDALRSGDPTLIPSLLRSARPAGGATNLVTFSDWRHNVLQELEVSEEISRGSQAASLPGLSSICKGFRRGELVIFTGPTGSGKTTLLSQLGVDFAQAGKPTLWGSFEIKNEILMTKMLQQFHKSGKLNKLTKDKLNQVANDFENLPIKFMNFHGASNIDQIMTAMDSAVFQDDLQHIIIDNLQFMMPRIGGSATSDSSSSTTSGTESESRSKDNVFTEKMIFQDKVIDKLRSFATTKNVNIILVIHPRKEPENTKLELSSIFGTAKATQEADMVFILQKYSGKTYLEVKKNRFDGDLGQIDVKFNPINVCYEEDGEVRRMTKQQIREVSSITSNASDKAHNAGVSSMEAESKGDEVIMSVGVSTVEKGDKVSLTSSVPQKFGCDISKGWETSWKRSNKSNTVISSKPPPNSNASSSSPRNHSDQEVKKFWTNSGSKSNIAATRTSTISTTGADIATAEESGGISGLTATIAEARTQATPVLNNHAVVPELSMIPPVGSVLVRKELSEAQKSDLTLQKIVAPKTAKVSKKKGKAFMEAIMSKDDEEERIVWPSKNSKTKESELPRTVQPTKAAEINEPDRSPTEENKGLKTFESVAVISTAASAIKTSPVKKVVKAPKLSKKSKL